MWHFRFCLKLAIWKQALKSLGTSQGRIYIYSVLFRGQWHCAITMALSRQTVQNTFTLCKTDPLLKAKQCYIQYSTYRSHAKCLASRIKSCVISLHADSSVKTSHLCIYSCSIWHITLCRRGLCTRQKLGFQVTCTCLISPVTSLLMARPGQCLGDVAATQWLCPSTWAWILFSHRKKTPWMILENISIIIKSEGQSSLIVPPTRSVAFL